MPSLTQICELVVEEFPDCNLQLIRSPRSREKLWTACIYDPDKGPKFGHFANESTPEAAVIAALNVARKDYLRKSAQHSEKD